MHTISLYGKKNEIDENGMIKHFAIILNVKIDKKQHIHLYKYYKIYWLYYMEIRLKEFFCNLSCENRQTASYIQQLTELPYWQEFESV
jgi:hypothetical protein